MVSLITNIYVGTIGLSFAASLPSFGKSMPLHLKVFSILIGASFLLELYVLLEAKNDAWLYNAFVLPEFIVYGWFFYRIIELKNVKKQIRFFFWFFPILWLVSTILKYRFLILNSSIMVVGSFFTVYLAILYYYQLLVSDKTEKLTTIPEFWIATGLLAFYSCVMPFFGMLNYLISHNMSLAERLVPVLQIVDTIMYCLFTYAFICQIKRSTRKY